ncbi:MAG: hypothetical protein H6513_13595 [Acidimicrobiaceae bacterium]|nr:hypothetical protein [Ilumatobacter sp.]MCB9381716.1 hypothetical protein [Acidimicrobiaceae bacterium]MCO5329698.1 hypothetical protein [Ilumatobacteraceae bacterium]
MSAVMTRVEAGDVIEMTLDGSTLSALVLLANEEFVILDPCDGRTPVVVHVEELGQASVFHDLDDFEHFAAVA